MAFRVPSLTRWERSKADCSNGHSRDESTMLPSSTSISQCASGSDALYGSKCDDVDDVSPLDVKFPCNGCNLDMDGDEQQWDRCPHQTDAEAPTAETAAKEGTSFEHPKCTRSTMGAAFAHASTTRDIAASRGQHRSDRNSDLATRKTWFASMEGRDVMKATAEMVVRALIDGDIKTVNEYIRPGVRKAFIHSLIHECARQGWLDGALWCADQILRMRQRPNVVTFNSVLNACAKAGNADVAQKWWNYMTSAGVRPNEITYNCMILVCVTGRGPTSAEVWLERMIQAKLTLSMFSFSNVMHAFAKLGNVKKTEAWLNMARQIWHPVDPVLYNSVINACAIVANAKKAEKWLEAMYHDGVRPDTKSLNSVIKACAKRGEHVRAEHWYAEMKRSGLKADEVTFGSLIDAHAKLGQVERAESYLEEMSRHGLTPNLVCYNSVIQACVIKLDSRRAWHWFTTLQDAGLEPNQITFAVMLSLFARVNDWASIEACLTDMVQRGIAPDKGTLKTLLGARVNPPPGLSDTPASCSGEATDHALISALRVITKACATAGRYEDMRYWFEEGPRLGQTLRAATSTRSRR